MKLSIIITVYNAEKYLEKCLESISLQNLNAEDFEVICINDGSTDNTLSILETFKQKYKNIIIVSHENSGEAISRNRALNLAKGNYITFLDSDDYYNENSLSDALKYIESENLDILYLKINHISEDYRFIQSLPALSDDEVLSGLIHERRPFPATIYKREIIGDVEFPLNIIVGPDSVFNAIVQSKASRVSYSKNCIYNYLVRPNSLSKKAITEEGYHGFINAIKTLDQFKKENFSEDNTEAKNYFDRVILVFLTRITELHILPYFNEQKYKQIKTLLSEKGYWDLAKNISEKYPYFHQSFSAFKFYQKWLNLKTKLYYFFYPSKK